MMDERKKKILKMVVSTYLETGEPVGSLVLSVKLDRRYSPATIRNILMDLEKEGYLYHTSASSGRIPTDKGLRYFIENLIDFERKDRVEGVIREKFEKLILDAVDAKDLIKKVVSFVSDYTNQLAFFMVPLTDKLEIRKIDAVRISREAFVMVVALEKGIVVSKVLKFDEEIKSEELEKLVAIMNSEFIGKTIGDIEKLTLKRIREGLSYARSMLSKLEIVLEVISNIIEEFEGEVIVGGLPNVFSWLDFIDDVEKIRLLMKDIEDRRKILRIVRRFIRENKKVIIGSEIEDELFKDTSIVLSDCRGSVLDGVIGLVVPKKTDYSFIVPFVEKTANYIAKLI